MEVEVFSARVEAGVTDVVTKTDGEVPREVVIASVESKRSWTLRYLGATGSLETVVSVEIFFTLVTV